VERRQDRPAVAVLQRHRLHVGAGVDDAEPDAVPRDAGDEDRRARREAQHRHGDGDQEQPGPQEHGAVAALGQGLRHDRAGARQQDHHQQDQRQRDVGQVPLVLEVREPRGQAEQDQTLGRETGGGGGTGPRVAHGAS